MMHHLKTYPVFYRRIFEGHKTFEIRKNDRDFRTGDIVKFIEYDPIAKKETCREFIAKITYVLRSYDIPSDWGLAEGFCIFGFTTS